MGGLEKKRATGTGGRFNGRNHVCRGRRGRGRPATRRALPPGSLPRSGPQPAHRRPAIGASSGKGYGERLASSDLSSSELRRLREYRPWPHISGAGTATLDHSAMRFRAARLGPSAARLRMSSDTPRPFPFRSLCRGHSVARALHPASSHGSLNVVHLRSRQP